MGRITREMADNAAEQLAKSAYDKKIEKAQIELKTKLEGIITKYIPGPIIMMMGEYGNIIEKTGRIYIQDGKGNCSYYHDNSINIPPLKTITVSVDDYKDIKRTYDLLNSLIGTRRKYKTDVSDALCLSIRTEKRCSEDFPEALPYLNFSGTTAIARKFDDLRAVLHDTTMD